MICPHCGNKISLKEKLEGVELQLRDMKGLRANGWTLKDIAKEYKISVAAVSKFLRRRA